MLVYLHSLDKLADLVLRVTLDFLPALLVTATEEDHSMTYAT